MFATIIMPALLAAACGSPEQQNSSAEARRASKLPSIRVNGKNYPFIRYPEVSGKAESRGQAFFLYPITDLKTRLSALEYTPGMEMKKIFAEDVIGIGGLVSQIGNQVRIDFLPVSVPIGVTPGQEWRIKHANRQFTCKSETARGVPDQADLLKVSCSSEGYTLTFEFDREIGVTKYQDFCDFSICTYKLADSHGLLSRSMTDFMGLPRI